MPRAKKPSAGGGDAPPATPRKATGAPGEPGDATRAGDRTAAARDLLARLIEARGLSFLELDRRLGYGRGRTRLLVQGGLELKFEPLIEILEEAGVDPGAYFQALFPPRERPLRPLGDVFDEILTRAGAPAASAAPADADKPPAPTEELEAAIDRLLEARLTTSIAKIFRDLADKTRPEPADGKPAPPADGEG